MPIRTRLTVITAGMMTLLLAASGIAIYWVFQDQVTNAIDTGLSSRTDQIVGALEGEDGSAQLPLGGGVIESDEAFAQVLDANGGVVDTSPGIGRQPIVSGGELPQGSSPSTLTKTVSTPADAIPSRLLVTRTNGFTVVVGASLEDIHDQSASLVRIGAVIGLLAVALTAGVGWFVAGIALRPVESMRRQAEELSSTNLHERLAVPNTGDELGRLATTLNSLLADVEDAIDRERTFMGQASHELRTPLANLKAEVDLALRRERGEPELRLALASVAEEVDRLTSLAAGLLDLARLRQGQWALRIEPVEPHDVVRDHVLRCRSRAESRGVEILLSCRPASPDGLLDAVPQRLGQVVSNLLDNAIAHSPEGSTISVTSDRHEGWTLTVADQGRGFQASDLESLTRPFASGTPHPPGTAGLGLSIVRAIVDALGGSLTLKNGVNDDGSTGGAVAEVFVPPSGR
jgi:signal transduction histidine kinase